MTPSNNQPSHATKPRTERKARHIYELLGPHGKIFAQGRTADQARGVYLIRFPYMPRDLDLVQVVRELVQPTDPYYMVRRRGRIATIAIRYP